MPNRIQNQKNALVTGAARGIGRAIALSLAKEGYNVAVLYLGSEEAAEQTCDEIRQLGRQALCIRCDVACGESCRQAVAQVIEEFGSIDVLVNNAGIVRDSLVLSMKEEDFDSVIDVNLKGPFHCIRFAARQMMRQRYGRIVNMASVVGVAGNAGQANYSASKAGVIGLTKSAAKELASRGITVNAIAPGMIETDMTADLADKVKDEMMKQIPLKRFGQAEDVANAAAFLVSDEAAYITGQVLHVDGGMVM